MAGSAEGEEPFLSNDGYCVVCDAPSRFTAATVTGGSPGDRQRLCSSGDSSPSRT
jgi:hypothetical protein